MKITVNADIALDLHKRADTDNLLRYMNDKEHYRNTLSIPHPYTEEHAMQYIGNVMERRTHHKWPQEFAVRHKEGGLIGGIGLMPRMEAAYKHQAEIGYWMATPFRNKGYMTQTVKTFTRYVFAHFEYIKLTAMVFADNEASQHVLKKCGYVQESFFHKHVKKDEEYRDCKIYATFKENWPVEAS